MQYLRSSFKQLQISIHAPEHTLKKDRRLLRAAARHLSATKDTNSDIIMARVLGLVRKYDKIDGNKTFDAPQVTEMAHFQKDLGLDSLDKVELVMAFEQEFSVEIPDEKADKLACCADVVNYIISEAKNDDGESHGP